MLGMSTRKNQDQFNPNELQVTASVPYAKNIFAMFINTNISIHSVTPRTPGPFRCAPADFYNMVFLNFYRLADTFSFCYFRRNTLRTRLHRNILFL